MTEAKFPKVFKCPNCGSSETAAKESCKFTHNGKSPEPYYLKADPPYVLIVPGVFDLVQKAMIVYRDICFECGKEYVTRIEVQQGQLKPLPNNVKMNKG